MKRWMILIAIILPLVGCDEEIEQRDKWNSENNTCTCGFVWDRNHPERYEEHVMEIHTDVAWKRLQYEKLKTIDWKLDQIIKAQEHKKKS